MRNKQCASVNFAANSNVDQKFLCQLLKIDGGIKLKSPTQQSTEYHHYYKNPCADNPCQNSGTCYITDKYDFNCACSEPYSGKLCEKVSWIRVSQEPLCFGAKDNSFGTFFAPSPGRLASIKLVHLNGTVTCDKSAQPTRSTFWGCFSPSTNISKITIIITDKNNSKLLPTYSNNLKGFHGNATAIVFSTENLGVFNEVTAGQEFRIWYYEDFTNNGESDNDGLSCANVYVVYWP
ncbi:uncharacterized protein LOC116300432 [Actinia tenebrosa]|uniref:Uncharacterized protein LOC116300432 n=1 Tax=Actinia tenebrosa TaxID=6105 RepID=A0A6P8ICC0_ACTTE|nr:uncharacterized protein LOC116300432 [Actinia tenebrosa]